MNSISASRIALTAAVAAAVAWTAKSTAIGIAGDNGLSRLEGPLFFAGLLAFLVAGIALGVSLARGRSPWLRAAAGLGVVVLGFAAALLVDALVGVVQGPAEGRHWVWVELNLWVSVLAVTGLAWWADERRAQA